MRSASAASRTTATPPTMSECPFRNLVAECMTMSAPSSSGRWIHGVAKVLSTTTRMPRARAIAATAAMSTSRSIGLLGDSIQTIFVRGRIDAANAFGSVRSANVKSSAAERRRTRSNSRNVPP